MKKFFLIFHKQLVILTMDHIRPPEVVRDEDRQGLLHAKGLLLGHGQHDICVNLITCFCNQNVTEKATVMLQKAIPNNKALKFSKVLRTFLFFYNC